jgi:hypothetical protein
MLPGFAPAPRGAPAALARVAVQAEEAVQQAFDQALAGWRRKPRRPPCLAGGRLGASLVIMGAENWAALGAWADHPGMGEDVRARLKAGGEQTAEALAGAEAVRAALIAEIDALLDGADALVLPAAHRAAHAGRGGRCARGGAADPAGAAFQPFGPPGHHPADPHRAGACPQACNWWGGAGRCVVLALAGDIARALGIEEEQA